MHMIRRCCLLPIALLILDASNLAGQSAPRSTLPAAYSAIREADLRRDVTAMAGPAMRGREGGTIDELRASMWMAEQYRLIGLKPLGEDSSWFQWFDITRTRVSVTSSSARVGGQAMTLFDDIVPLNVVPAEASGQVLWVADATDTTINVSGRI